MDLRTQSKYKTFFEKETWDAEVEDGKTAYKWRFYYLSGINGSQIYPFSMDLLAIQVSAKDFGRNFIGEKVYRNMPEYWKIIQNGDDRMVFTFPNKDLDKAADFIRARKRRQVTEQMRESGKRLSELASKVEKPRHRASAEGF